MGQLGQGGDGPIDGQGQEGGEGGAGVEDPVALVVEADGDEGAQPTGADEGGQGGGADVDDGGRPDAGHEDGPGQRQLDPPEHLGRAHPHAAGRLDGGRIDAGQAGHGVPQHRQHRVGPQPDHGRPEPDPGHREGQRQHRDRRHRLPDVGHEQQRRPQAA